MDHQIKGCHDLSPSTPAASTSIKELTLQGIWKNNPALVQVLGLCPTLAVTTSATNALGMGISTLIVLALSNLCISLFRHWTPTEIRIPVYVLLIAALVTSMQLFLNAYFLDLYQSLGIFIALIVTNCIIVGRAEAFANKNNPLLALIDGIVMGLGFTLTLFVLGAIREILGQGTLFAGADHMFGAWASILTLHLLASDHTCLLMILPPGAFMVLGFLVALKNALNDKFARKTVVSKPTVERARVTQL